MVDDRQTRDSLTQRFADARDRFRAALAAGQGPRLEDYLDDVEPRWRDALLHELLALEWEDLARRGDAPEVSDYQGRFPEQADAVVLAWNAWQAKQTGNTATQFEASTAGGALTESWKPAADDDDASGLPEEIPGFEVLHLLGRGGMGIVLKARHMQLGRLVALKMPLLEKLEPRARQRFLREARAAAGLNHPHICPIYEVGEVEGRPYIEMAYIDGVSLKEWAAAGPVGPHEAAELVAALARAVAYAHEQGVIHRDIKPSNVMVESRSGNPVLMDFGLAKDLAGGDAELTQAGQVLGTPAYMAPEQATGGAADEVGPAADIYALGGVLYALLVGRAPFQGSVADVLRQVQTSEPKPPRSVRRSVPRDMETICLKAMAREPQERYASAAALADDLQRFCAGEVILARRTGPLTKAVKWARRHPVAAVGTLAVCLVIGLALFLVQRALAERRIATQVSRFSALLEEFDGSQAGHDRLAQNLDELGRLDPQQADLARGRLIKRYEGVVHEMLQGSLDEPRRVTEIENVIARLEEYAPQRGAAMRQSLDQRQRTFSDVFDLAAPFDGWDAVFRRSQVMPVEAALRLVNPEPDVPLVRVNSLQRSRGNVELLATFSRESWQADRQLGLALNAGSQHAYDFLVTIPADGAVPARMSIEKNGAALAEQELARPRGSLRLLVRREGTRLTFQVDETAPLEFDDVFALTSKADGFFGVVWPREAELERLTARRQSLPVVSSPLEDADLLFQSGDFEGALRGYESQLETVASEDLRQEARCKRALCLLRLGGDEAAAEILDEVAGGGHPRWSPVAACHLWSLRLAQNDYDAADQIFTYLESRYEFEDLATLLPRNVLHNLLLAYSDRHRGPNLFGFSEADLQRLERGIAIGKLLTGKTNNEGKFGLLRGNRALGHRRRALRIAFEMLQNMAWLRELPYELQLLLVEEYCWMMRHEGDVRGALKTLDSWIAGGPRIPPGDFTPLHIERARCYIALKQWEEAESEMDAYFATVAPGDVIYRLHSAACLVEGFLRLRRNDEQGAQEIWQQGLYDPWSRARRAAGHEAPPLLSEHYDAFSGMEFHQYVTLACLTGQMTVDDIRSATRWAMFRQKHSPLSILVGTAARAKATELTTTFNSMCSTEYGRARARELAFQQLDFPEFIRLPMYMFCLELVRRGAFGDDMSPDERDLVWDVSVEGCRRVESGRISGGQVVQLFMAWELQTGFVAWGGVEKTLEPSIRGPLAYLLGCRLQRQGNPEEARKMFRTAAQDAVASDQPRLQALADERLENVPAHPPQR